MTNCLLQELRSNGILSLRLNRPAKRNALSSELRTELREVFVSAAGDDRVKCVTLTGAGGHFCAGGDLSTMGAMTRRDAAFRMSEVSDTVLAIAQCSKPKIFGVAGHAAGAGVGLALLGDIVVASEDAKFSFSFLNVALGPDWGLTHTLACRVGGARSKSLLLRRDRIDAAAALQMGLIDEINENNALDDAIRTKASALIESQVVATATVVDQMTDIKSLTACLNKESHCQLERFTSAEHRQAIADILGR